MTVRRWPEILATRCGVAQQNRPEVRVAVCGGSLYMAGLAASLEASAGGVVLRLPVTGAALAQALEHLSLAVVAFDLGEIPGDLAISLLRDRPDLILIGIDPSDDRTLVLSSRVEQPLSAAELVRMITDQIIAIVGRG